MSFFNQLINRAGRNPRVMPSPIQRSGQSSGLPTGYTLADVLRMRGGNRTSNFANPVLQRQPVAPPIAVDPGINQMPEISGDQGYLPQSAGTQMPSVPQTQQIPENVMNIIQGLPQHSLPEFAGLKQMLVNMASPGSGYNMGQLGQVLNQLQAHALMLAKQGRFE